MEEVLKPDLCVIGAGSGGLSVAAAAAQFGVPVVLIYLGFLSAAEMADRGAPFVNADAWEDAVRAHARGRVPEAVWGATMGVAGTLMTPLIRSLRLRLD